MRHFAYVHVYVYAAIAGIALAACGPTSEPDAELRGLSANAGAKNIALVIGAANGLPGIDKDIKHMQGVLEDSAGNFNFQTIPMMDASPSQIIAKVKEHAPQVGDDGTFVFYFSGHGGGGALMAAGGGIRMNAITAAIREVRTTPLKRLMVFIDTCNNGSIARPEGSNAINLRGADESDVERNARLESEAAALADAWIEAAAPRHGSYEAGLYQELFVQTSSTETESSNAGGNGSSYTVALAEAFRELKGKAGATIKDLAELTKSKTVRSAGHTPVHRAVPESLWQQPLLGNPSTGGGTNGLYLKLASDDATGATPLVVASPLAVTRVVACYNTVEICRASRQADLAFAQVASTRIPGINVFQSSSNIQAQADKVITLLGFDAASNLTYVQGAQFKQR